MYVVLTNDGVLHEAEDAVKFVALLEKFGPKAVDHSAPPEQWTDLSRALMEAHPGGSCPSIEELVDRVIGGCSNCGVPAGMPCKHDAGCIDSDRG